MIRKRIHSYPGQKGGRIFKGDLFGTKRTKISAICGYIHTKNSGKLHAFPKENFSPLLV